MRTACVWVLCLCLGLLQLQPIPDHSSNKEERYFHKENVLLSSIPLWLYNTEMKYSLVINYYEKWALTSLCPSPSSLSLSLSLTTNSGTFRVIKKRKRYFQKEMCYCSSFLHAIQQLQYLSHSLGILFKHCLIHPILTQWERERDQEIKAAKSIFPKLCFFILTPINFDIRGSLNKFPDFFLWALLLKVHTSNTSPLRSNLLRLQYTCCTVPITSRTTHGSPLVWACLWPSSQPLSSPRLSHNDSLWA